MSPSDGERRLNSAIAPRPGFESASANLGTCELHQLVEPRRGRAGVECLARQLDALAQVGGVSTGCDRARGVEQDRVARAALLAAEDAPDRRRVLLGASTGERGELAPIDPEVPRIDDAVAD